MENIEENKNKYPDRIQSAKLVGGVLLLIVLTSFFSGTFLQIFGIEYNLDNPIVYMITIIVSAVSLGGVIEYVRRNKGLDWEYIKGENKLDPILFFQVSILVVGLSIVVSDIDNLIQKFIPMNETYMEIFEGVVDQNILLVFLSLCVVAPIFEETLFRGIILRGLLKNLENWSAIFYSAFLFGILHMNIWQGIGAFFIGVILGWVFYKTRSLYIAIYAHFVNNFLVVLAVQYTSIPGFSGVSESGFQPLWFTLIGLAMLVFGIVSIEKKDNYDQGIKI